MQMKILPFIHWICTHAQLFARSFILILFFAPAVHAQKKGSNVGFSKFGAVYEIYSGDNNKSFSAGGPGYGGEIGIDSGFRFVRYYAKLKATTAAGTQNFLDAGTEVRASYALTQIAPEIGVSLYPMGRPDRGLGLYLFGGGIFSMNLLELKPISVVSSGDALTTFTSLKSKEQGFGSGFGGGIGFELLFGKNRNSRYMLYGEVGVRQITASIASRSDFQINNLFFTMGIGL